MASRYTDARRAWVPHKTQGLVEIVWRQPPEYANQSYVDHLVSAVESMASLAWDNYKDPTLYWLLAELNPGIVCPDDLTYGHLIHIPTINPNT